VTIKSPDGHEVKLKLNITPEAIKKWVLTMAACRGSGEAQPVSDLKIKNRCRGRVAISLFSDEALNIA